MADIELTDLASFGASKYLRVNSGGTALEFDALTSADVGLSNVDNTSDANKPVSTATQTALDLKANIASPTFTGTVSGITKSMVGLGNVDNTSDAAKPISTLTQTALDAKVDENSAITGATKTKITYDAKGLVTVGADATTADIADSSNKRYVTDAQLVVIGNTSGTNTGDQNLSAYATKTGSETLTNKTLTSPVINSPTGIVKGDVGLGNVDNTADSAKPVSTAQQTALDAKLNHTGGTLTNGIFAGTQVGAKVEIQIACSDLTTALTTGTNKAYFRIPYALTLTAVRASVLTAPTGSTILIDINEGGTTLLSTKLMIDAGEKTSTTATTPYVISDSAIADDAEIGIDLDQVGSSVAGAGLIVTLIGVRA